MCADSTAIIKIRAKKKEKKKEEAVIYRNGIEDVIGHSRQSDLVRHGYREPM
jgi:hypothetical protein